MRLVTSDLKYFRWGSTAAEAAGGPGDIPAVDGAGCGMRPEEERDFPSPEHTIRVLALKVFGMMPKPSLIDLSDLQQAGTLGLLQAQLTYNPSLGVPLAVYAKHRIRGEMLEAIHRSRPLGTRPRSDSHARASFIAVDDWRELAPAGTRTAPPEDLLAGAQRRKLLSGEVHRMPVKYRMLVQLKYSGDLTLSQIGARLRVKESRACQLHRSALSYLRKALNRKGVTGLDRV